MRFWLVSSAIVALAIACGGATAKVDGADAGSSSGSSGTSSGSSGSSSGSSGSSSGSSGSSGTVESIETCAKPGECVLGAEGCCGITCGAQTLIGIRRGTEGDLVKATCDQAGPVACPKCARRLNAYEQAFCTAGKCVAIDVRTDPISSCTDDTECVLRYASCCQPCNGGSVDDIVAVAKKGVGDLELNLCTGSESCDKCLPSFPPGTGVGCNKTTGHCEIK